MKKHQKHAKLKRPDLGNFGRNELAIVGAPCDIIEQLAEQIATQMPEKAVAYVDTKHGEPPTQKHYVLHLHHPSGVEVSSPERSATEQQFSLMSADLILVNGNHEPARKQLIMLHPAKENSLQKRLEQLTDVVAMVLCEGQEKPFPWLMDALPHSANIPIFRPHEVDALCQKIQETFKPPTVKGLILAGGMSTRMGMDKGQIEYHGLPQVDYLLQELSSLGIDTYVSCRPDQYEDYKRIPDAFVGLGPYGGLLSAFQHDPDAAWLVLACDLPNIDRYVLKELLTQRAPHQIATAFYNETTGFPDPLLTLWEPRAYHKLLEYMALGYSCPRKVLINEATEVLKPKNPAVLDNINTPEDRKQFLS